MPSVRPVMVSGLPPTTAASPSGVLPRKAWSVSSSMGSPPVGTPVSKKLTVTWPCAEEVDKMYGELGTMPPPGVVVANAADALLFPELFVAVAVQV